MSKFTKGKMGDNSRKSIRLKDYNIDPLDAMSKDFIKMFRDIDALDALPELVVNLIEQDRELVSKLSFITTMFLMEEYLDEEDELSESEIQEALNCKERKLETSVDKGGETSDPLEVLINHKIRSL